MNISVSRRMKVNLGNFESFEFSAQATVHHGDMGYTDQEIVEEVKKNPKFMDTLIGKMQDRVEDTLDRLLIADIEASREITEEEKSVVLRAFTSGEHEHDTTAPPPRTPTNPPSRRKPRRPN